MTTPHATTLDVLRRYQQALIDQNADDLADLYAPDAVHELPFLFPDMPARYDGREEVRTAYASAWGASDARPREVRTIAVHHTDDPHVIIAEQTVLGVVASTGEPFEFPGILVLRIHHGEITHVRDYMDGLTIAHSMGRLSAVARAPVALRAR